ncbi:uncharacterized protein LOC141696820 isoform X2 [Apium graveolens]|uniref:uncharacterized protein LOC141696820 isoform X2 n=1 Tax=Apium graveolens TaxID=4045 RepID=UPI003D78CA82
MDELDTWYRDAISGDLNAIAQLENKADWRYKRDRTILHRESESGNTERVRFILREFAYKNLLTESTTYNETALHLAIDRGHTEVAKVLIKAARRHLPQTSFQAFLRKCNKNNDTALHYAVIKRHVAIVKLLVEADSTDRHSPNKQGKTPMFIAVEEGLKDIVEIISTTCEAPSLDGPNGSTAMRINTLDQVKCPDGIHYKIMDIEALYDAAIAGDADAIANLEMKVDMVYNNDATNLHIEAQDGNTERVRFILREFANKNLLAKLTIYKETALHLAIYRRHTEVAKVIIEAALRQMTETSFRAFLRQGDKDNDTALHLAVMEENVVIVKLLVEADPTHTHTQNNEGYTPMYIAVDDGFNEIVEIISTTCTAPSLNGPNGSTALRINNLDQVGSPGGPLYKIMDRDALYAAAFVDGNADVIANLEMQAERLLTGDHETILPIESQNGNTERVPFFLREFASKNLLAKLTPRKYTALHWAIYSGHTKVAETIIATARKHLPETSFQAFLRQGDEDMETALHAAVMKGNIAIVKLLVEADPTDRHAQNRRGKTPIYIAVEEGYAEIVKMICTTCTAPLNLDGPVGKHTALQAAVKNGKCHIEVVKDLIHAAKLLPCSASDNDNTDAVSSFQAFLRHGDEDMNTALHLAVMRRKVEIVKLLVDADPTDKHAQNKQGETPMYIAVEKEYNDIVEIISTTCNGAPYLDGPDGSTAVHFKNLRQVESPGGALYKIMDRNALYAAAFAGDGNVIAVLGEKANRLLLFESRGGNTERVRFILRKFANKNLLVKLDTLDKQTALHLATCYEHTEVVEILIAEARRLPETSFQAFLRHGDEDMNTALHFAVMQGNLAIVKLLVKADPADTQRQNKNGKTPIYIAVEEGFADIVKVICATCTEPLNLHGPVGEETALQAAVKNQKYDIEVVKVLIDAARRHVLFQDFLRHGDKDMNTALHLAVMRRNLEIVKLLVGADPTDKHAQNSQGKTPIYIAAEGGNRDIVKVICNLSTASLNFDGPGDSTALHAALKNRNHVIEVVEVLFNAARRSASDNDNVSSFQAFLRRVDENLNTALHVAVKRGNFVMAELLVKSDPTYPGSKNKKGKTPFLIAVEGRYTDIVKLLCSTCTSPFSFGPLGWLHAVRAVIKNLDEELSASNLLNYAGDFVLYPDRLGWSLLHHAAYNEFNSIITRIVEEQKRFKHEFVYKDMVSTPFLIAAEKGYTSTVILLMQLWPSYGSSAYTAVNREGQNILHLAALQNKKEMIEGILKYCPEEHKEKFVNRQDKKGQTPLHLLIKDGCFISQLMKYKQLDINLLNKENWTPPGMLYFNDQIIGDQVKIKIALHHIQHDLESDIFSSPALSITERDKKDVLFNEKSRQMKYEKYAGLKENTHAIANCFMDAISGDHISKAALEMEAERLEQEEGKIILHVESMRGVTERVEYILREFGNKNLLVKLDTSKQTALHLAVDHGHTQVVKVIIDAARHLPSSSANNLVTPFQDFVRQANGQMGNTALHLAVLKGNVAIVKLLVDADPDGSHVQNSEGKTPIYIAVEKGHKDIVKEICTTCTALSLDGPGCKTTQDESRSSVLQLAVERNCVDVVKMILEKDLAYQDGRKINRNGLMCLIYKAIDNECSDAIVKLLSQKYQVGIMPEHEKALELILAIKRRNEDSVLSLLGGAKDLVNFTQDNGWTALHYAVYHEFDSVLGAIIGAQEDVGHQFVYGDMVPTPFHVAVECGYTSTLVRLMQLWPAPSSASEADKSPYIVVNEDGRNILHLAAADNSNTKDVHRKEMVEGILKYCPEMCRDKILKQNDTNGDTPLHVIISQGYFIPELIKDKELGTKAKNQNNFTPWEMLYHKNDVVADQVHIKIAIDEVESNQSAWNLSNKRKENKNDIWKNIPPSKRRTKDVIFDEQKKILMHAKHLEKKEKLERYKMRTNTQIIVSALITTVTFTVGFTMPGGLHQSGEVDEGLVLLSKKNAFNTFMVSDAIALLLSTSSLFFYFLESINEDPHQVSKLNAASTVLNTVSVMAMMLTFVAGTYLVLSHSPALAITVCIIGSLFFLLIIILLIKIVYERLHIKRNLD